MQHKNLAELAKESDTIDPDIWNYLSVSRDEAYELMASSVLEMANGIDDENAVLPVIMASMTHLLVENFILNLYIGGESVKENE